VSGVDSGSSWQQGNMTAVRAGSYTKGLLFDLTVAQDDSCTAYE